MASFSFAPIPPRVAGLVTPSLPPPSSQPTPPSPFQLFLERKIGLFTVGIFCEFAHFVIQNFTDCDKIAVCNMTRHVLYFVLNLI